MEAISQKLREIGLGVTATDNAITVTSDRLYRATSIKTNPYPGFPTDMHPQFSAMLALARGISSISEGIWGSRFRYAEELRKMGADIVVDNGAAHITGVPALKGAVVKGSDLRAGAALVIAALAAEGESEISGLEFLDRGYEDLVGKLKRLGADIRRE
jgi:UDP-N-acetylglucosamine 1-carboxyvinyltransferase